MVKVVLDTVIFVRCLIKPYGLFGALVSHRDKYEIYVSREVVKEYLEVLHRPEITAKFQSSLEINLEKIVDLVTQAPVVEIKSESIYSRDSKDDKFLALAKAAKADYLVTEDKDLLVIKHYKSTKIVTGLEFLRLLPKQ